MTDDELIERMRAIPFIGFEDRGQQGTQDASICHDAADRIKAMSERVAELEGVLQSGLKVIEQELRHLLESCCLIDKETLEPIRETLEDGPSETVVEMEAVIERATALLNKGEAQKGEGE